MKWKDVTTYYQGEKERVPRSWQYDLGPTYLIVHRHIHYSSDQWLLTCPPFFDKHCLHEKDVEAAKREAVGMVQAAVERLVNHLGKASRGTK